MLSRSATTRLAPLALLFLAALTMLALPHSAGAASMIPNPVVFNNGAGTSVSIAYVGTDSNLPAGGTDLVGTTSSGDLVLEFQLTVLSGSIDYLEMSVLSPSFPSLPLYYQPAASGTIDGTGTVDVASGAGGSATTPRFNFASAITTGLTSSYFYVSYDPNFVSGSGTVASGAPLANGTEHIQFKVRPTGGTPFTNQSAVLVPEPGSLLLLGLGLGFIRKRSAGRKRG